MQFYVSAVPFQPAARCSAPFSRKLGLSKHVHCRQKNAQVRPSNAWAVATALPMAVHDEARIGGARRQGDRVRCRAQSCTTSAGTALGLMADTGQMTTTMNSLGNLVVALPVLASAPGPPAAALAAMEMALAPLSLTLNRSLCSTTHQSSTCGQHAVECASTI